jgi:hypothetical protein
MFSYMLANDMRLAHAISCAFVGGKVCGARMGWKEREA